MIPLAHILIFSALLFSLGIMIVLMKKNAIVILMGIELILNAANINLVAFSHYDPTFSGQMFTMFVMVVAVSEIAIALAIVFKLYHHLRSIDLDLN
ncbi:NADH-quinone oxidoreductase subunit NuoK [Persicobacter psychrovividus]|uniref:NADH-quinone oxidoreductase subunit K n=1 Tax=Persicobacter psychrovividus TaxID=387638 RepID=A0ABN6L7T1_9BACT|nr:NADH-quinone oxidoreductase subunit K [Persicobacter psychrovividus]